MYWVIFIVVIILLFFQSRCIEHCDIHGFWTASPEFCTESDLRSMILYIGDGYINKSAYMIIENDNGLIVNDALNIGMGWCMPLSPFRCYVKRFNVSFNWHDDMKDVENVIPKNILMEYYPTIGKIVLSDSETTYAVLYKNIQMNNDGE